MDRKSSNAKAMEITDNPDDTHMETSDSTEESGGTEGETADGTSSDAADGDTATQDLPVSQITIAQNPIKVTYTKGESMDLTGMVVDGYFLDGTAEAVKIIREINSPNLKLLYDVYHMQIMQGNILDFISKNIDIIGHFHSAGVPGRAELFDTEVNYPAVIKKIDELKYAGCFGLEYFPKLDHTASLKKTLKYLS
jgi:hydroxypyruvate isomerase